MLLDLMYGPNKPYLMPMPIGDPASITTIGSPEIDCFQSVSVSGLYTAATGQAEAVANCFVASSINICCG
jgi:hypothetical protein